MEAVNISPSALFRSVSSSDGLPTILFDEIDTIFGPRAKDNEDIRGLLNAGHRRGAKTYRSVLRGKQVKTQAFEAFCAVALAGIGWLPDPDVALCYCAYAQAAPGRKNRAVPTPYSR
jgi:hypothetical protein